MVQTLQIELSIIAILQGIKYKLMLTFMDISEISSMIQGLNSYNLLSNKVAGKVIEQFTDQIEKGKKYRRVGNELSIKGNI